MYTLFHRLPPSLLAAFDHLKQSKPVPTDPYTYYTDDRLVNNGFRIRCIVGKEPYIIATGVAYVRIVFYHNIN